MNPWSLSRCRWRWTVRTEQPRMRAKRFMEGQHSPFLLLAWSERAQRVPRAYTGTPSDTSSSTLGILVNLALPATTTSLKVCDGCALVQCTKAAVTSAKGYSPPLFLCLCRYLH